MDNDFFVALLHFRTLSDFMFCLGLGSLRVFGTNSILKQMTVFGTNSILKQIPLSEQNIFSNYVCKLLNYHLKSSDRIKPFQIKSICSFEYLNKIFCN